MAAINLAWSVLGNPARRAKYDAMPQPAAADTSTASSRSTATGAEATPAAPPTNPASELPTRRAMEQRNGNSILDFGRYAGWTVGALADHDPNYLRWLARTPIGRRLTTEIDGALGRRETEASTLRSNAASRTRRHGVLGGFGSLRTAAR
jgi:curved DNA-binding protein CbpA